MALAPILDCVMEAARNGVNFVAAVFPYKRTQR